MAVVPDLATDMVMALALVMVAVVDAMLAINKRRLSGVGSYFSGPF